MSLHLVLLDPDLGWPCFLIALVRIWIWIWIQISHASHHSDGPGSILWGRVGLHGFGPRVTSATARATAHAATACAAVERCAVLGLTVLSRPQVASNVPCGFHATHLTSFSWPSSVATCGVGGERSRPGPGQQARVIGGGELCGLGPGGQARERYEMMAFSRWLLRPGACLNLNSLHSHA